ncbi:reverse transcriptase domain-containing protein [Tanacetum coccineum]
MSTQFYSSQIKLHFPNLEKSLQFRRVEESESDNLFHDHIQGEDENAEDVQMADHLRPMEELLQIPIVGIEDAIVVQVVLANEFELKIELLDFISNNPFFGLENDDPHSHIKRFDQITQTFKINQVPHDVVKLILFSFSLKEAAETWLENEPPCSITTWDDLVSKFLNRFYPHSKTRELRKEIMNFQQVFEALTIIENKAKVRTCRNKPQVSSSGGTATQIDAITALTKQVEVLKYHIASMRETYDHNQEAAIQLIQNQMGQMAEAFQEIPLRVLPSNTKTNPLAELNVITSMDSLTLDGSFIPHSNFLVYQEEEQEPETITEVVEISSSQSTPLVPPSETPSLSTPKPKENLGPNPHHPSIPCLSRLQEEKFQALENPTGRADYFVYRIDIVDSLCYKFPIENNSLSGNPTPSSDFMVESLSPLPTPFGNKEKSSGSTTSHSDHSLLDYEALCFDVYHIEEKSNGSTTSHSDLSLLEYESFHFDLSIDPLPPADRSDSHLEDFADELAHIISPPEYDHFYFDLEADLGELTRVLKKNIYDTSTKDLTINELNNFTLLLSDCDSTFSEEFSEIDLLVTFPSGNKDKIFDPGIFIINGVKRFHILTLDDFSTISFVSYSLLLIDPSEIKTFLSFPFGNEGKVFDPGILLNNGIFSFTRKSPHLLIDNFMIDNIPSGESKVHIEVLSVLWGNRLPIPDGSLPLARLLGHPDVSVSKRFGVCLGWGWRLGNSSKEVWRVARIPDPTMIHLEGHVALTDWWIYGNNRWRLRGTLSRGIQCANDWLFKASVNWTQDTLFLSFF